MLGYWPRAAAWSLYAILAWSFLLELLGSVAVSSRWLLDTSVFHHLAPSPAVSPHWASAAVMVGLGALGAIAGTAALNRRDLVGD